ncbi:MAG: proline--tRNA ligase [Nitrospinaceae bacterium]|nr:MAG: proline--tRNA ligase [Nitrospinaceae bacterium]
MRYSQMLIPTLKESPADAEVVSHKLMVRAGMIRQLASGIYSILPLGLRVLRKIERIIREELDAIGGQEVFLPSIQPSELWVESGRWSFYGKELLRIKDRHDREFCYGPTHEEVITDIVRREVKSYRNLPLTLYQIQTKFRDEVRPRFGLMRGREFMMKDAYSFHVDVDSARETYGQMAQAYANIFERCGLTFVKVQADSGTIGGSFSHEFAVLADSGEDRIGFCNQCGYASNLEMAAARPPEGENGQPGEELREVATPGKKSVEEVAWFLSQPAERIVKTLLFETDRGMVAGLVRGDRELNPIKLKNLIGCEWAHPASEVDIASIDGPPVGYVGPVGLGLKIYADREVTALGSFITGANKQDAHFTGVSAGRDFEVEKAGDLREVRAGDSCPHCPGLYQVRRGIEVGHIFILGNKYSRVMKANFLDPQGKETPMEMGCYGIGVGRTAAAAIEQNHDERGIVWPAPIAPFQVMVIPVNYSNESVREASDTLYRALWDAGVEALLDDRSDRLGVKLNDADLLGAPLQIILGPKNLENGQVEIKVRKTNVSELKPLSGAVSEVVSLLRAL